MPEQDHEYRVKVRWDAMPGVTGNPLVEGCTPTVEDVADAGRDFREIREKIAVHGGRVELQRRAVGAWETVESAEHLGSGRADADLAGG